VVELSRIPGEEYGKMPTLDCENTDPIYKSLEAIAGAERVRDYFSLPIQPPDR
jgi:hypothetical protein